MIPTIIHYCWFGKKPLPEEAKKCIASWKQFCPEYKIIEWNEENFPIEDFKYAEEAYNSKKWAFVSDVARLYALVKIGGIYIDTDVELVASIDDLLDQKAFSGFESNMGVPTGLMASEPEHPFFSALLNDYKKSRFITKDGNFDLTTNVTRITNSCLAVGLKLNNKLQTVADFTLYPKEYFCPLNHVTGILEKTNNTRAIHWFAGSWKSDEERKIQKKAVFIRQKYGHIGMLIAFIYEKFFKIKMILRSGGFAEFKFRLYKYFKNLSKVFRNK